MRTKIGIVCMAILALASVQGFAATCKKTQSACADSTAVKTISGVPVTLAQVGGCWATEDTYSCDDPGGMDFCAGLVDAGCALTSSVCSTTGIDGTCNIYKDTFRCGDKLTRPVGIVTLADSYTIVKDSLDRSACASVEQNSSCALAEEVCIEAGGTRNINGMDVYKPCWKYEDKYTCSAGTFANYCAPLQAANCAETTSICKKTAWNGECIEFERTYNCNDQIQPVPTNVIYLDSSYTITDDGSVSTCTEMEDNSNCTLAGSTCIEGPETRTINGLAVYKDCWKTQKEYTCAASELKSNCAELKARPECIETTAPECVDTLPGGQCGVLEHTYECSVGQESTNTVTDCSTQSFCVDGSCFDTGYTPDTDFGTAITSMEVIREAAEYGLFKGEHAECGSNFLKNCCKSAKGGQSGRNDTIASELGAAGFKVGAEVVKAYGSQYVFEGLVNSGSTMLENYAFSALTEGTLATAGNFSIWGAEFSFSVSGGFSFVGFDPWSLAISVAIMVITEMMKCEEEDQITSMKKGQNLCHKVGSYCASKFLGSCVSKKESYCCFPSVLGRIVQEQGRPQIGRGWGDKEEPDCSGFTLEEIGKLDFSKMNFSEFIRSINVSSKTSTYAIDRLEDKVRSYYDQ